MIPSLLGLHGLRHNEIPASPWLPGEQDRGVCKTMG